MSDSSRSPEEVAQGTPKDFLRPGERAILIEVAKLQATLNALEKANDRNISDFRWTWSGLAAGFLILAGFFTYGYLRLADQLDQKTTGLLTTSVRVETKLDDLSQRLLPLPAPPRR